MNFRRHSHLEGLHARLSASSSAWVNYDLEKLEVRLRTLEAAERGTRLHELAHRLIKDGISLPDEKRTLNLYVNDAIKYKMVSERVLFYSYNFFGTPDTIAFDPDANFLRIHDLKTGTSRVSIRQLEVYAAYFCLEYGHKPFEIGIELRIYKEDEVEIYDGDPHTISHIMDQVVTFDRYIEERREA